MARQYQEWTDGVTRPVNPDCGIEGCKRAEYRQGLCRSHYELIPHEVRWQRARALMIELHEQGKRNSVESVRMVQEIVDA